MTIDLKTVKHISKLSRISINEEKAKKLEKDLNSIFEFIEKLNELDTTKIEPLTSIEDTVIQLRKDKITIRPIAGTRPRGANPKKDKFYKNELFYNNFQQWKLEDQKLLKS